MLDGRILVALTDSRAGHNAAAQAIRLAASTGSKLAAISVAPSLEGDLDLLHVPNADKALIEPHQKALDQAQKLAAEQGLTLNAFLASGQAHEKIVDQAEALDTSLIVLGESRRGAVERAVLGPTASRVVGYAPCDVLVVPEDTQVDFTRIVLAADGSTNSRGAVKRALELARSYGSQITCISAVHILPEYNIWGTVVDEMLAKAQRHVDLVLDQAKALGIPAQGSVSPADPSEAIKEAAVKAQAGLIVMGSHGRTGLKRLLMGSVAENVLAGAPCPTLIVP